MMWLESLESRSHCSTATLTAERFGDTLVIEATSSSDTLSLRMDGKLSVGVFRDTSAGSDPSFYYRAPLDKLRSIVVNGGTGQDELRVDFSLHAMTHTRSIELRRVYHKGGTRLTAEYASTPLEGVLGGSTRRWLDRHKSQVSALTQEDRQAQVLFMGDSMAERFITTGLSSWDKQLRPRKAVNLGLTGDTTSNVLHRIEMGLLDGFSPRVIVLAIGANNVDRTDNVDSTLRGIRSITRAISARLPETKILIASVFPRRREFENNRVTSMNARLAGWDDGNKLRFLDVSAHFAAQPVREDLYRPADIHLNPKGYRLWANLLTPALDELMA